MSLTAALVTIAVAAVVLAGAVALFVSRRSAQASQAQQLREARNTADGDNPEDLAAALEALEGVLSRSPGLSEAHALAATFELERWLTHRVPGSDARARDHLQRAEQLDAKSADRFAATASLLLLEGKAAAADEYVEQLRARGASAAPLWLAQAKAQAALGNLPIARRAFSEAAEKGWTSPRYAAAYGEALLEQALLPQAIEVLEKTARAHPSHRRSALLLTLARLYRKDPPRKVRDTLEPLLANETDLTPGLKAVGLSARGEALLAAGNPGEALEAAEAALAADGESSFAALVKVKALAALRDPRAAQTLTELLERRPFMPLSYFEGASALVGAGEAARAVDVLAGYERRFGDIQVATTEGKLVGALERDDRYWVARGDVLLAAGRHPEALAAFDKAVAARSVNLSRAHFGRARVLLAQNKTSDAEAELALITPGDGSGAVAEAYQALGDVLFAKGELSAACQQYALALARMRDLRVPVESSLALLDSVHKRLVSSGQREMAQVWLKEARPIATGR